MGFATIAAAARPAPGGPGALGGPALWRWFDDADTGGLAANGVTGLSSWVQQRFSGSRRSLPCELPQQI
jgi:hypothetical protein